MELVLGPVGKECHLLHGDRNHRLKHPLRPPTRAGSRGTATRFNNTITGFLPQHIILDIQGAIHRELPLNPPMAYLHYDVQH